MNKILNNYDFDIIQIPANVFDRRFINDKLLNKLSNQNCEIQARSIFLQGLLISDLNKIPKNFFKWKSNFQTWHKWLAKKNADSISAALKFILSIKEIDNIIISCQNTNQLMQILNSQNKNNIPNFFPKKLSCNDENLINPQNWNQ